MGYNQNFFSGFTLPLPALNAAQKKQRAALISNAKKFELQYTHYSVVQNKGRKFAFYAATNIDGKTWDALVSERLEFSREGDLQPEHQIGDELYDFLKSRTDNDFDKGHIAKFQDPQWGDDEATIKKAADDTMKFPNCVPQHHRLNRGAWKSLEDYVIKKFTRKTGDNGKKISVFAGPLLLKDDPFYVDEIDGKPLQIPCHFWKVIVYPNRLNKLCAVAFLMSQRNILFKHGFVVDKKSKVRKARPVTAAEAEPFSDFKSGEPYQITIDFIEQATGFSFGVQNLHQPYTKEEATELIYKRVEVPVARAKFLGLKLKDRPLTFEFEGISL